MDRLLRKYERDEKSNFIPEDAILRRLQRASSFEAAYKKRLQDKLESNQSVEKTIDGILKLGLEDNNNVLTSIHSLDEHKHIGFALYLLIIKLEKEPISLQREHVKEPRYNVHRPSPLKFPVFEQEHQPVITYREKDIDCNNGYIEKRFSGTKFEFSLSLQSLGMKDSAYSMEALRTCAKILGSKHVTRQDEERAGGGHWHATYEYRWDELTPKFIIEKVLSYENSQD